MCQILCRICDYCTAFLTGTVCILLCPMVCVLCLLPKLCVTPIILMHNDKHSVAKSDAIEVTYHGHENLVPAS